MNREIAYTDLREYLAVLRARKVQIALVALLALLIALGFAFQQTAIYEGKSKVLVRPTLTSATQIANPQPPNLETERQLVLSPAVGLDVKRDLHSTTSVTDLVKHVQVDVVTDTEVLIIRYHDPDPAAAARGANAFAGAYVAFRTEQALSQIKSTEAGVQSRLDAIKSQVTDLGRRIEVASTREEKNDLIGQRDSLVIQQGVLTQRLLDLQSDESLNEGAAAVIEPAVVPASPVSPKKIQDGALGLVLGLIAGVGIALVRERLDDRLRGREEIERRLGAPVLAAIPKLRGWRQTDEAHLAMRDEPRSPVSEAYRTLGTNIQYLASQRSLKVIMVTSSLGGEGKTTTSANLAMVLARTSKRVVLVSADLRRPRLHKFFGIPNDVGLSDVLASAVEVPTVVRDPGLPNLRIVTAGELPEDPAQLLAGPATARFFHNLAAVADFVVVDTPPVLAVADASILARHVDGTIFVMDADLSSRSSLVHARDQLQNAGAEILGAVHNNFDPTSKGGYGSYYYYYQYYGVEENGSRRGGTRNGHSLRRAGASSRPTGGGSGRG